MAIQSFHFSISRSIGPQAGGRNTGKPTIDDIRIQHNVDKYSAKLLNAAVRGVATTATPGASIIFSDDSGPGGTLNDYLRIDLNGVMVSRFDQSGDDSGAPPSDLLFLNPATITFTTHSPAGTSQTVTYNFVTQS